jgi:hypothetical protein
MSSNFGPSENNGVVSQLNKKTNRFHPDEIGSALHWAGGINLDRFERPRGIRCTLHVAVPGMLYVVSCRLHIR